MQALHDISHSLDERLAAVLRSSPPPVDLVFPPTPVSVGEADEHFRTRNMVIAALERIGPAVVPDLAAGLRSPDPVLRRNAAMLLPRFGKAGRSAIPDLAAVLKNDPDTEVRKMTVYALGHLGEYHPALLEALKDADVRVRVAVPDALERADGLRRWDVVIALADLLEESNERVRASAYGVLDHRADTSVPTLIRALDSVEPEIRTRTVDTLEKLARHALTRPDDEGRLKSALTGEALTALRSLLNHRHEQTGQAAARSIKAIEQISKGN